MFPLEVFYVPYYKIRTVLAPKKLILYVQEATSNLRPRALPVAALLRAKARYESHVLSEARSEGGGSISPVNFKATTAMHGKTGGYNISLSLHPSRARD
jgi:hypothetical protein